MHTYIRSVGNALEKRLPGRPTSGRTVLLPEAEITTTNSSAYFYRKQNPSIFRRTVSTTESTGPWPTELSAVQQIPSSLYF